MPVSVLVRTSVPLPVVLTSQIRLPSRQAEPIMRSSTATPAQDESAIGQVTSGLVSLASVALPSAVGQP